VIVDHLYIDPGSNAGWAGIVQDNLKSCGLARISKKFAGLPKACISICVERPVIYPRGKQKAKPKNVLRVAEILGELVNMAKANPDVEVVYYEPRQWKGQTPKELVSERIIDLLTVDELSVVNSCLVKVPNSLQHNVMDALGLWLYRGARL
jgi:hypothetical protein